MWSTILVLSVALLLEVEGLFFRERGSEIRKCGADDVLSIEGYALDLDGTMYSPANLYPGTIEFFDWMEKYDIPYVLLSNSFKSRKGVASKFAMEKFKIHQKIDPERVHTAANAISSYLTDHAPAHSKIYAVSTSIEYSDGTRDSIPRILSREVPEELFKTWEVRTHMSLDEIHHWAHLSRDMGEQVYVVQAFMGSPNDGFGDDKFGSDEKSEYEGIPGYTKLDYELLAKMTVLLRNGAFLLAGAPDVAHSNPKSDVYPNIDTSWPTMGGVESLLLTSAEMFPGSAREAEMHANTGKGGNKGAEYMMEPGIARVKKQRPGIDRRKIVMIGDNFGTDIMAGRLVGLKTILVLTGAHQLADAKNWAHRPDCYLLNVGEIPILYELGNSTLSSE